MASQPQQPFRGPFRQSILEELITSSNIPSPSAQASNDASDTQPISLNDPATEQPSSTSQATANAPTATSSQESSSLTEVRTCWICQQDDTEDTPENNIWRTPCPCSLTAHDSCLLEWIANEEAPKPGQLGHNRKIVCPQCQAEIKIQRPGDLLVSAVDNIQRMARLMMIPTVAGALLGTAYSGFLVYGMNSLALVFGSEKASELLMAGSDSSWTPRYKSVLRTLTMVTDPFMPSGENLNLKLFFTLPLIGPALILMRTSYADQYLPILAPLYFVKPSHRSISWPPSPGLAIAALPYIQRLYRELYRYAFSSLEKKWELAVQRKPREGETAEQIAAAARAEAEQDEGGHAVLEIEWGEVEGEDDEDAELDIPPAADIRAEIDAELGGNLPPNINIVPGAGDRGVAPQPNAPQGEPRNGRNGRRALIEQQDIDLPQLASTVVGALFMPAISSLMGTLLELALPTSMTSSTITTKGFWFTNREVSRGLLKEKWGRSIVGGCLFVVLKDAVILYCKWKKARDFGKRRVLDFVGERGRVGGAR